MSIDKQKKGIPSRPANNSRGGNQAGAQKPANESVLKKQIESNSTIKHGSGWSHMDWQASSLDAPLLDLGEESHLQSGPPVQIKDNLPSLRGSLAESLPDQFINAHIDWSLQNKSVNEINRIATATVKERRGTKDLNDIKIAIARDKLEKILVWDVFQQRPPARKAKFKYGFENIVAIGIGVKKVGGRYTDEVAIVVTVMRKVLTAEISSQALVPKEIDGIATDVIVGGRSTASMYDGPFRPVKGGVSIGNSRSGSGTGTITCVVATGDTPYILSCRHVFAPFSGAALNDPIIQPSLEDNGVFPSSVVAYLAHVYPIALGPGKTNFLDCALAAPDRRLVSVLNEYYGRISDQPTTVKARDLVRKCGRTTEETESAVITTSVGTVVQYGAGIAAHFSGLICVAQSNNNSFAKRGDSGSLVLDMENNPVGMIVSMDAAHVYIIPMISICKMLNVRVVTTAG